MKYKACKKISRLIEEMDKWVEYQERSKNRTIALQELAAAARTAKGDKLKVIQSRARNMSMPPRVFNVEDAISVYIKARPSLARQSLNKGDET